MREIEGEREMGRDGEREREKEKERQTIFVNVILIELETVHDAKCTFAFRIEVFK